jgi:hypothetical protein
VSHFSTYDVRENVRFWRMYHMVARLNFKEAGFYTDWARDALALLEGGAL